MTLSLAACSSSDSEGVTSDGTETTETTDGAAATDTAEDDAATEEDATGEDSDISAADADSLPVVGEVTFDGEVAAGSQLVLTLTDMTDANVDTNVKAEETIEIEDGTSPISFELAAPRADLDPRGRYSLRARIVDAGGADLYTTNSANFIDPVAETSSDLGSLPLIAAS